jgi:hypothetical protein
MYVCHQYDKSDSESAFETTNAKFTLHQKKASFIYAANGWKLHTLATRRRREVAAGAENKMIKTENVK